MGSTPERVYINLKYEVLGVISVITDHQRVKGEVNIYKMQHTFKKMNTIIITIRDRVKGD